MLQLDIFCHEVKLPLGGMGYIFFTHWLKGPYGNPQTSQAIAITGYSPQPDDKALFWKTTLIFVTKHREVELLSN